MARVYLSGNTWPRSVNRKGERERERERESGCLSDIIINASGRVRTSGEFTVDNEPSRGEDESARHSGRAPRASKSLHSTNDRWSRWKRNPPRSRGEEEAPDSTINDPRLHYSSAWKNICRSMLRTSARRRSRKLRPACNSAFISCDIYLFTLPTACLFAHAFFVRIARHAAAITARLARRAFSYSKCESNKTLIAPRASYLDED